jgi:hypothetical protein
MAQITEQREVANEITELISNPTGVDTIGDVSALVLFIQLSR